MKKYIGMAVHGYRTNDTEELVTRVIVIGNHKYNSQGETAIRAATKQHPRPRWYIGYGGDYIPANPADIANITVER